MKEKYDINNIESRSIDERNLMCDLVYMNVISAQDALGLNFVAYPLYEGVSSSFTDTQGRTYYGNLTMEFPRTVGGFDNRGKLNYLDGILDKINQMKDNILFYEDKNNDPERRNPVDSLYLQEARDFNDSKQRVYDVLMQLL